MIGDYIKRKIRERATDSVRDLASEIYEDVNYKIQFYKRKVLKDLASMFLILIAVVFLAMALIFFFIEYAGLSRTISFAILGAAILIVALILKVMR